MASTIQPSFAKGELAPELHGRVDTAAYRIGLATARNAIVHTYGGISRRPGSRFVAPVKEHTYAPRLVPFQFKTTDSYVLEFGNLYMRVIRDGGQVLETAVNITGATKASPVVVTAVAHGYSNGDEVYIASVGGMTELNTNRYIVAGKTNDTFQLTHQVDGTDIDGTGFTTYTSGGTVAKIYEIVTPYATADLFELNYTQSADVMTIVHKNYSVYELSRTDHNSWSLDVLSIGPVISAPADIVVTVNTTDGQTEYYKVTAIDRDTSEEGLAGLNDVEKTISGATQASPVVVTATAHGFLDGDEVQIDNVVGMTELNTNRYIVDGKTNDTFKLTDELGTNIDGTGFTAYSSAGIARQTFVKVTNSNATVDNSIAWTAVTNASVYAVYRRQNGIYGLIGETELTSFDDGNITPDTGESIPQFRDPFKTTDDNPGAVGYFQQRRVFGGSLGAPDTSKFTQTARYSNFNISRPQQADDAITATLSALQVNEIRHYIQQNDLLTLTSGSEWRINSGPDSIFAADTITVSVQTYWGTAYIKPIISGNIIVYVTADGSNVRSFAYDYQLRSYAGGDLNIFSQHLLNGFTITDMTYLRAPESRLHLIRNDGTLITMSIDSAQELIAWTRWDTNGKFEACTNLPLGGAVDHTSHTHSHTEDALYIVAKRTINGNTVRYIEAVVQRYFDDVRDCFFVDSGLSLDNPVTVTGATQASPVVITAVAHGFSNGDEIDVFDIEWAPDIDSLFNYTQPDQLNKRRYTVASKTNDTFELTTSGGVDIDGTAFNAYIQDGTVRLAVNSISGLNHLEGEAVDCLADGSVITTLTVSGGAVTLPRKFSRVHIGLKYITDIETLNIEVPDGTIQGFLKKIPSVNIHFLRSRGIFVGPDKDNLFEMKQREFEDIGDPTDLITGFKDMYLSPDWNSNGRLFLREKDPLPLTILAIVPQLEVGNE